MARLSIGLLDPLHVALEGELVAALESDELRALMVTRTQTANPAPSE